MTMELIMSMEQSRISMRMTRLRRLAPSSIPSVE